MTSRACRGATLMFLLGCMHPLLAQDASAVTPPEAQSRRESRATHLPSGVARTFHFDAGIGSFLNSLYTNPHDDRSGDLSDNWQEGDVEPALSGVFRLSGGSAVVGMASAVGERTFLGFSDWGTCWQGEIAGEYFLSNSNLISHQVRVRATPYTDWTINDNFTLSVVGGGADPGDVVRQVCGRTGNFAPGLLYLTY